MRLGVEANVFAGHPAHIPDFKYDVTEGIPTAFVLDEADKASCAHVLFIRLDRTETGGLTAGMTLYKDGRPQRDLELVPRPIVVPHALPRTHGHAHGVQRGRLGRAQVVQRRVHVPAVKARVALGLFRGRQVGLVEVAVRGVLELDVGDALVVRERAVADELHLGDAGDRFEEGVEDG